METSPDEEESLFEDSLEIHGIDWVAMFAYCDETENAPLFGVASYLFSKNGAKAFRRFFNDHILNLLPLDKNGVKMYHSSQCILGYEPFDKLSTPEREQIVDLMVEGIKKSVSLGVVILMPKDSYSSAIKTSPDVRSLAGDEYSQCLTRCIEYNADWLDQKKIAGRIEYVIEAGCNHQKEATAILAGISNSPELKRRYRLHDYSFRDKGPHIPQIFTPDLLAWEWQRAHINAMFFPFSEIHYVVDFSD